MSQFCLRRPVTFGCFKFCQQVGKFALTDDSSLYILLPPTNTATHLQTVEQKMTDTALREMIEHMKTVPAEEVEVTLPLIKLDVQTDMNILIKKLGLFVLPVLFFFSTYSHHKIDTIYALSVRITLSTSQLSDIQA